MLRRFAAIALAVSFLAMATSGLLMFVIEKPSFTLQMHPVHKIFGLLMIIAAVTHLCFNYRALMAHLKTKASSIFGGVLVVLLVLLYGVAVNNQTPPALAEQMDAAAAQVEAGH